MSAQNKRPAHRPGLADAQKATILGGLLMLRKGTPEYRRKRLELAQYMERTERSIEIIFEQLKDAHIQTEENPATTSGEVDPVRG